jgi:hypothetical protein
MNLLESTQKLLQSRLAEGMTIRDIAKASKGEVAFEWLRKFADGTSKNPTVIPLQKLHNCLKKIRQSN